MVDNFYVDGFIGEITGRKQSLLRGDILAHDKVLRERIEGKSVLVIGGAGTIGSFFIESVLKYRPSRMVVVDINENGLTELVRDLRSSEGVVVPAVFLTYPISLGSAVFAKLLRHEGPFDIVANFAAHKHVRSEKDHYSIEAMIDNNVFQAKGLLDLLMEAKPKHFFCVSTDKAANPVNVMGATKKLMEEVILAYADALPIVTARFANVAFSNGSLLAGFLDRMGKRQPLSVPRGIKRFFVSPTEAGELCMLACVLGMSGDIFFPKLDPEGDMIAFDGICIDFLKGLGYKADVCGSEEEAKRKAATWTPRKRSYPVYFFESDTSGEKAFEEFYTDGEALELGLFEALGVIKDGKRKTLREVEEMIVALQLVFGEERLDKGRLVSVLGGFVEGFEHIERGKGLDQKM